MGRHWIASLAKEQGGDARSRTFKPWSHLVASLFAQVTHAIGLHDICDASRMNAGATAPNRNNLSHANRVRDCGMAETLFRKVEFGIVKAMEASQNITMTDVKQLGRIAGLGVFVMANWSGAFPNPESDPFPPDARPEPIRFEKLFGTIERNPKGEMERLLFHGTANDHEVTFRMTVEESDLIVDGRSLFDDKSGGCGGSPFFSFYAGDLNQDGTLDFLLNHWQGGNGWMAGGATLTFILSTGESYNAVSVLAHYPWEENFVMLDGKLCFIHTSIGEVGDPERKCVEYYFVHNILVIDGTSIRLDNSLYPGFPMLQADHMNCDGTQDAEFVQSIVDQITPAQKDELIQKATEEILQ